MRPKSRAQALVEFALAFPIFVGLVLGAIQLGLVLLWYADDLRLTRDAVRWLAVNPNAKDNVVAAQIASMMLPTMTGGGTTPSYVGLSGQQDIVDDHNAAATYRIGKLTARFTPCVPDQSMPPVCTHADRSPDGGVVYVEMSYDISSILFLPTRMNLGFMTLSVMPSSTVTDREWMVTE